MKNIFIGLLFLFFSSISYAQVNLTPLISAGVEDTQRFAESFLNPGLDAVAFSLSNGWYNSGKAKGLGRFEIAFIGNVSFVSSSQQSFELNTADYNFLQFQDGSTVKNVGNILGQNDPGITALAVFQDGNGNEQNVSFALPQGLARSGVNFVPTGMIQASVGLIGGIELKGRYLPEVDTDDGAAKFYGIGIQNEFTDWIPGGKLLPIHISGAVSYSNFQGNLVLSETPLVSGSNQRIDSRMDAWAFDAIVSTKLPVINFYAGLGYVKASSRFSILGEFTIDEGLDQGQTIVDPFSTSSSVTGFRGTLGTKLTLGFLRLFADYSIQEFNTLSVGLAFGI
jgi:hypothetical protein